MTKPTEEIKKKIRLEIRDLRKERDEWMRLADKRYISEYGRRKLDLIMEEIKLLEKLLI